MDDFYDPEQVADDMDDHDLYGGDRCVDDGNGWCEVCGIALYGAYCDQCEGTGYHRLDCRFIDDPDWWSSDGPADLEDAEYERRRSLGEGRI